MAGIPTEVARWFCRESLRWVPQRPYFRRGQRRALTFGLSAHRSFGREETIVERNKKQALYPRPLRPRPERRGFTAQVVKTKRIRRFKRRNSTRILRFLHPGDDSLHEVAQRSRDFAQLRVLVLHVRAFLDRFRSTGPHGNASTAQK